jgi:hypothetical protein
MTDEQMEAEIERRVKHEMDEKAVRVERVLQSCRAEIDAILRSGNARS